MKYNTARRRAFDFFFFSMRLRSARTQWFFLYYTTGRSVFGKTYHKGMGEVLFYVAKSNDVSNCVARTPKVEAAAAERIWSAAQAGKRVMIYKRASIPRRIWSGSEIHSAVTWLFPRSSSPQFAAPAPMKIKHLLLTDAFPRDHSPTLL